MTTDIKEWIAAGRKYADAIDKDRGFDSGLTDCLRGLSDALEAMAGEVDALNEARKALIAEVRELSLSQITIQGQAWDNHSRAEAAEAERDRLKAALVGIIDFIASEEWREAHTALEQIVNRIHKALGGDAS